MKNLYLRTSVALACALGLAACGGEDPTLLLQVQIGGVNKDGLTIRNNGGTTYPVAAYTQLFNFPDLIEPDSEFNIEVVTEPSNAKCDVINGKGKAGAYAPNSIGISCIVNQYNVTGSVSGLKADGLVLNNGAVQLIIPALATSFTFTKLDKDGKPVSGQVGDGDAYGLTIFKQPAGQVCTITNGTGTMGAGDVKNIAVNCI